jgi:hypothetical protein
MAVQFERLEMRQLLAAPVFSETGGLLVMEAEHFSANVARGGKSWVMQTSPSGFAGSGVMVASPNTGTKIDTSFVAKSPELSFNVSFSTPGTYKVWIRGRANSGNDDSLHVGLDNAAVSTADRITLGSLNSYVWTDKTSDGPVATINIAKAGMHTINVWMREDGLILDRILLSRNGVTPSGIGPAESSTTGTDTSTYVVPSPLAYPNVKFHLTARPFQPIDISRDSYLDIAEQVVRAIVKYQNSAGQIIDPIAGREFEYATPYFANALGTLLSVGRAQDLLANGVAAMNSATLEVSGGINNIPDQEGEFFIAPLTSAISLYAPLVPQSTVDTWRSRMSLGIWQIIKGYNHNWRTYAMLGEWMRAQAGLVDKASAVSFIEKSWTTSQVTRLTSNDWNLYHDYSSDPDTIAYDAAARGNLYALVAMGYDGPSAGQMRTTLEKGDLAGLYIVDPTGQGAAGGRSSDHVWNDIAAGLVFQREAEQQAQMGNLTLAGQYQRAAELAVQSIKRWQRSDGSFFVTKNQFDPSQRVGYADYSALTNYNGTIMFDLAQMYLTRQTDIPEQPTPAEIGGYALETDSTFSAVFADAGGMQMQAALRGSTSTLFGQYWTPLGVTRFSRADWDSRLGPGDGVRNTASGLGVTFAPTFLENGKWIRLASVPDRYQASFSVQFTNPILVRCTITYKPIAGKTGPTFTNQFVITPDGILCTATSSSSASFGMTWPVLSNDGTALSTTYTSTTATTKYPDESDAENFIALDSGTSLTTTDPAVLGSYGDLVPVRSVSGAVNRTFVYPSSAGDPSAESVRTRFKQNGNDFSTVLGRVQGNTYVGRTSAGGFDDGVDLNGDGTRDVTFSKKCSFVVQLNNGKVTAIESDRAVSAVVQGKSITLSAYTPVSIG